jgi:hypothetical protein
MMTVAVVMVALRSAHHTFDAANNAPADSTDNAANCRANRASRAPTFGGASLATSNNALSLRRERHRKSGENESGFDHAGFHEQTPFWVLGQIMNVCWQIFINPLICRRFRERPENGLRNLEAGREVNSFRDAVARSGHRRARYRRAAPTE